MTAKHCSECYQAFGCGSGSGNCWCMSPPPYLQNLYKYASDGCPEVLMCFYKLLFMYVKFIMLYIFFLAKSTMISQHKNHVF